MQGDREMELMYFFFLTVFFIITHCHLFFANSI